MYQPKSLYEFTWAMTVSNSDFDINSSCTTFGRTGEQRGFVLRKCGASGARGQNGCIYADMRSLCCTPSINTLLEAVCLQFPRQHSTPNTLDSYYCIMHEFSSIPSSPPSLNPPPACSPAAASPRLASPPVVIVKCCSPRWPLLEE